MYFYSIAVTYDCSLVYGFYYDFSQPLIYLDFESNAASVTDFGLIHHYLSNVSLIISSLILFFVYWIVI
ncbi:predicted protein [Arabidopsis lyrata subsp. lyrata]|uniref:Predicted protein n=1 Tax=Arabidopsis lyrata subsp. lyrata TaxID=81972 RepID=D7MPR5_ARALL|nr:predicted protein [Arabidopsis lyrata subsp. lyrata]